MKPLHLGKYFAPQIGGMERFLEDLIRAQHAVGTQSAAIVHADEGSAGLVDPSWLRRVPVFANVAFAPIAPRFFGALKRAIADVQPDYLHIHTPNLSAFVALFLPSARRIPWVVHWHSDVVASKHSLLLRLLYPLYRPFERALLERATLIICTSRQYLESSAPLAAFQEKCAVVPLGIDPARMAAPSAATPNRWTQGRHRLLAVGRLTYYKGFDTLIRAVAQIPDAELRIVGDGQDRAALARLCTLLGVNDRVFFEGALSDADCALLYQTAELFCLPSRERTEAFGVVLLEAMHYGLPLLASAIPGSGVSAVVRNGVNGRLLPQDDAIAWRDAIAELATNVTERRRLGDAGRERVARKYAIKSVAHQIELITINWLTPDAPLPEAHERPLIVIPARDEAATMGAVVSEIIAMGFVDVLVVDDASNDTTRLEAMKAGARCIRAPLAQGAWGAMQTGIRYAVKHSFSSVITMDADGQHRAHEITRLLDAARHADVVIGACAERGSAARKCAWWLFRMLTGFNLSDLTSGFRLYNAAACKTLAHEAVTLLDYQDMGVLLALERAGLTFAEVEVMMMPRMVGVSRIFYSWWAVTRYMLQTIVLCISKRAIVRAQSRSVQTA
jgi:glycosyltransferase involved in cell wall biosynthesis